MGLVEYENGDKEWFKNGVLHRLDGPAVEYKNGYKSWFKHGNYHRINGPAAIYPNGHNMWYINDKLHRIDGPAINDKLLPPKFFLYGNEIFVDKYNYIHL